jgi:hypothetical protein
MYNILEVRYFRATECDTGNYLAAVKFRERLAVSKQKAHKFHIERFNLKKLNEVDVNEQYRVEI